MLRGLSRACDTDQPRGCLIGMFALELSVEHEGFRAQCDRGLSQLRTSVERELAAAMKYHDSPTEARKRVKPLAAMLVAMLQGSNVLERAAGKGIYLKKILTEYRAIIDQAVLD